MQEFIAGVQDVSSIDYPGHLSSVIFFQGCNLRCKFCHNSKEMVLKKKRPLEYVFKSLNKALSVVDSVIVSGGEPTLHDDAVLEIKKWCDNHRLLLGIETNGTFPDRLKKLAKNGVLNFIAMDIKSAFNSKHFTAITGNKSMYKQWERSFKFVKKSKIPHEFRMTVVPSLHTLDDIRSINKLVKPSKLVLQRFKPSENVFDKTLNDLLYSPQFIKELKSYKRKNKNVEMRFWN